MCLRINDIKLTFDEKVLFYKLNASFCDGFNLLMGESGSGKTTLLRLIKGFIKQDEGEIYFSNKPINILQWSSMCIMLKQGGYYFEQTPIETLKMPFYFKAHTKKRFDLDYAVYLLERFGLDKSILYEDSNNLSGGQLQRIALVRAIMLEGKVFLLDEPTSALDENTKSRVYAFIKEFCKNRVCLVSSHDEISKKYCDKLYVIKDRNILNG